MIGEFRQFILRGNLVDLAVAVVIGTAFGAVVTALVEDLVTPLIAAIGGEPDFSALKFEVNGSQFLYGDFLNALLAFVLVAAVVFFLVVKPVNTLMARYRTEPPADRETQRVLRVPQRRSRRRPGAARSVPPSSPAPPDRSGGGSGLGRHARAGGSACGALALGGVQRFVCGAHELVEGAPVAARHGNSEAQPQRTLGGPSLA